MVPYLESLELTNYHDRHAQDAGWGFSEKATELPESYNYTVPTQCASQIGIGITNTVKAWLKAFLEESVHRAHSSVDGPVVYSGIESDVLLKMDNDTTPSFALVDALFKNISDGITSNFRQAGNTTAGSLPQNVTDILFAGNQPAYGIMLENNICVHTRWQWLVSPATLILLTAIFVIRTMFDRSLNEPSSSSMHEGRNGSQNSALSRWHPAGVWKSSLLPLMFHGLEDRTLSIKDTSRLTSLKEMEKVAKMERTGLTQTEDEGWKFVKID